VLGEAFEPGLHDVIVVVDAPHAVRLARAVARGMDPEDATRRMHAQPAREDLLPLADVVIDNAGGRDGLAAKVGHLWESWTSGA
jgi:dephospho-CoA kinase